MQYRRRKTSIDHPVTMPYRWTIDTERSSYCHNMGMDREGHSEAHWIHCPPAAGVTMMFKCVVNR